MQTAFSTNQIQMRSIMNAIGIKDRRNPRELELRSYSRLESRRCGIEQRTFFCEIEITWKNNDANRYDISLEQFWAAMAASSVE